MNKKKTLTGILLGMTALLAGGFAAGGLLLRGGVRIPVVEVSELSTGFFSDSGSSFGTVTTKANQEVYLDSEGLVTKVYVKPGDRVKVGDNAALDCDTTLLGTGIGRKHPGEANERTGTERSRGGSEEASGSHTYSGSSKDSVFCCGR